MTMRSVLVAILLAVSFPACGESAEAKAAQEEILEALDATKNLVVASLSDLKQKAEPYADRLGDGLSSLRAELAQRGEQVKAEAAPLVAAAEARLSEAKQRLAAARDASADEAKQALAELQASLRAAAAAFAAAREALQQPSDAAAK